MFATQLTAVLVEEADGSVSGCCGTSSCSHTIIQHDSHIGYLNRGKLLCRSSGSSQLRPCSLGTNEELCTLIASPDDHVHGPQCGHEQIPHGDHMDFLVAGRLHHVTTDSCCSRGCLSGLRAGLPVVVDHGPVSVLRHRLPQGGSSEPLIKPQSTSSTLLQDQQQHPAITTKIYAAGICCPSEVPIINRLLERLPGVESIDVDVVRKVVAVIHVPASTSPATLVATLNAARLEATLGDKVPPAGRLSWVPPYHILGGLVLLLLSLLSYLPAPGAQYLKYLAVGAIAVGILPILLKAVAALRCWMVDINVLMTIAVAGALALQDFREAAIIVLLFAFAQWLEARCVAQASNAISSLLTLQPEVAVLAATGVPVAVESVPVGEAVLVKPGERIPCDGDVVEGSSAVDESMLTGETRAVVKEAGSAVFAGTINSGSGALVVQVTSSSENNTLSRLTKVMESAISRKTHRQQVLERFARVYSPLVIVGAVLLAAVPSALNPGEWQRWVYLALEVLVTACPCALVLSTPVANVCALAHAARHGVLLKSSAYLEAFGKLKVLSFDKTGTLTQGHFTLVESLVLQDSWNKEQLLQYAASLEQHSNHPLAASIIAAAAQQELSWLAAEEVSQRPGVGLQGHIAGQTVVLCSYKAALEADTAAASAPVSSSQQQGAVRDLAAVADAMATHTGTACCLLVDGVCVGALILCDEVRPGAAEVLKDLQGAGLRCVMLSGDNPLVAKGIGSSLGLQERDVHGGLMPEEKLELVCALKQPSSRSWGFGDSSAKLLVAHVGDGINDGPALAAADVGVAMGVGGSALAVEAADVALFTNKLSSLVFLRGLSLYVYRLVMCNITFAVLTKAVVLVLIGLEQATLWIAVAADVGSSLLVVLASLTVLSYGPRLRQAPAATDSRGSFWGLIGLKGRGSRAGGKAQGCCQHHHHTHGHAHKEQAEHSHSPPLHHSHVEMHNHNSKQYQPAHPVAETSSCCHGHQEHHHVHGVGHNQHNHAHGSGQGTGCAKSCAAAHNQHNHAHGPGQGTGCATTLGKGCCNSC